MTILVQERSPLSILFPGQREDARNTSRRQPERAFAQVETFESTQSQSPIDLKQSHLDSQDRDANSLQLVRDKLTLHGQLTHAVTNFWANKEQISNQIITAVKENAPAMAVGFAGRWAATQGLEMVGVIGAPATAAISAGVEAYKQGTFYDKRGAKALYEKNTDTQTAPTIHTAAEASTPLRIVETCRWLAHQCKHLPENIVTEVAYRTNRRAQLLKQIEEENLTYSNLDEAIEMMRDLSMLHYTQKQKKEHWGTNTQEQGIANRARHEYMRIYNDVMSITPEEDQSALRQQIWDHTRADREASAANTIAGVAFVKGVKTTARVLTGAAIFDAAHGIISWGKQTWEAVQNADPVQQLQTVTEQQAEIWLAAHSESAHAHTIEPSPSISNPEPHFHPEPQTPEQHYMAAFREEDSIDQESPTPEPTTETATIQVNTVIDRNRPNIVTLEDNPIYRFATAEPSLDDTYDNQHPFVNSTHTSVHTNTNGISWDETQPHVTHEYQIPTEVEPAATTENSISNRMETAARAEQIETPSITPLAHQDHQLEAIEQQHVTQTPTPEISTSPVTPEVTTQVHIDRIELTVSQKMSISSLLKETGFFGEYTDEGTGAKFVNQIIPELEANDIISDEHAQSLRNAVKDDTTISFAQLWKENRDAFKELDGHFTDKLTAQVEVITTVETPITETPQIVVGTVTPIETSTMHVEPQAPRMPTPEPITFQPGENTDIKTHANFEFRHGTALPLEEHVLIVPTVDNTSEEIHANMQDTPEVSVVYGDLQIDKNDVVVTSTCYMPIDEAQVSVVWMQENSETIINNQPAPEVQQEIINDQEPTIILGHSGRFNDINRFGHMQPELSMSNELVGENYNQWIPVNGEYTRTFEQNGHSITMRAVAFRVTTEFDADGRTVEKIGEEIQDFMSHQRSVADLSRLPS